MKLHDRQQGLLRLVEGYRDEECRRILNSARREATELLGRAYRRERGRLHGRILAERSRAQASIQAARSEQITERRRTSDRASLELMQTAWLMLRERLAARWQAPEHRRRWARAYLRRGLALLPRGEWRVRHASPWDAEERRELEAELTAALGQVPEYRCDEGLRAGLIIESAGAVLDASLEGLLRDRARLEARLLALMADRGLA